MTILAVDAIRSLDGDNPQTAVACGTVIAVILQAEVAELPVLLAYAAPHLTNGHFVGFVVANLGFR